MSRIIVQKAWIAAFKIIVTARVQLFTNVSSFHVLWTAEHFATRLYEYGDALW